MVSVRDSDLVMSWENLAIQPLQGQGAYPKGSSDRTSTNQSTTLRKSVWFVLVRKCNDAVVTVTGGKGSTLIRISTTSTNNQLLSHYQR